MGGGGGVGLIVVVVVVIVVTVVVVFVGFVFVVVVVNHSLQLSTGIYMCLARAGSLFKSRNLRSHIF